MNKVFWCMMSTVFALLSGITTVSAAIIHLKSGQKVEGSILKREGDGIVVDFDGIAITYGVDEILKIEQDAKEGQIQGGSVEAKKTGQEIADQGQARNVQAKIENEVVSTLKAKSADLAKLLEEKKYDDGVNLVLAMRERFPDSDDVSLPLAMLYYRLGKYNEALQVMSGFPNAKTSSEKELVYFIYRFLCYKALNKDKDANDVLSAAMSQQNFLQNAYLQDILEAMRSPK